MGVYRQVPDRLRQLHPRYGTPWIGILVFGAAACLILIPGQADFLGLMYAFGAMLSFSIAHLVGHPAAADRARPRAARTGARATSAIRGRDVPVFAVVGLFGTGGAFLVTVVLYLDVVDRRDGVARARPASSTSLYRRSQGLDLTSTAKVAIPQPVTEREAEYESVLVAYDARALRRRRDRAPRSSSPRGGGAASTCS